MAGTQESYMFIVAVVQSLSHVRLFVTPWTAACQASLSFTISQILLKLTSIESVMPYNNLILCRPLLLLSICPRFRIFSSELALIIRCPKYWSFSFSISPFNEYSGLISFRIDQGILNSLLQTSVWKCQFFGTQPSLWSALTFIHDYWKNHSFDYMDFCPQSNVYFYMWSWIKANWKWSNKRRQEWMSTF